MEHDEWDAHAREERQHDIYPPQDPGQVLGPGADFRDHHEDEAADYGGQGHREGANEHGLDWVMQHGPYDPWVAGVSDDGYEGEEDKEEAVQEEEGIANAGHAPELVGGNLQQVGHNAGAHVDRKP